MTTATRGNKGQAIGYAARILGMQAVIVVPHGNSVEKNAAMRAQGVELIEHGPDNQAAREYSETLAAQRGLHFIPPFHPQLVRGISTYPLEFMCSVPDLDTVYVPIGMGSGIAANIAIRDALGLKTRIVGVVSENAPAYALSFEAGRVVTTDRSDTLADGVACRVPDAEALAIIQKGAERVVTVSEAEIQNAIRAYFTDTHNLAEGAGALPLAALLKERSSMVGKKVGLVLTGGNIDQEVFQHVLKS